MRPTCGTALSVAPSTWSAPRGVTDHGHTTGIMRPGSLARTPVPDVTGGSPPPKA